MRLCLRLVSAFAAWLAIAQAHAAGVPRFDHVVVVIMENHSAADIYGSSSAPYINNVLLPLGAQFSHSFAVTHPSQPNYIALFSGSAQGVVDDSCPQTLVAGNLGQQLLDAGLTFAQYSEDLPLPGSSTCSSGLYVRRHNPVPDFAALPISANLPFSQFAGDLSDGLLPTVSFVAPQLCDDMHGDGFNCNPVVADLIALGDTWLSQHVPQFLASNAARNGLMIVTWDEDDSSASNNIPTIFIGSHVQQGFLSVLPINHYSVLRTLEDMYKLGALGNAAGASPITDVWDDVIFADIFE